MKLPDYSEIKVKVGQIRRRLIPFRLLIAILAAAAVGGVLLGVAWDTFGAYIHVSVTYVACGIWPLALLVAIGFGLAGRALDRLRAARKSGDQKPQTLPSERLPDRNSHNAIKGIGER